LLKKYDLNKFEELGFNELVSEVKGKRKKAITYDYVKSMQIFALVELSKRYNKLKNNGYRRSINVEGVVVDSIAVGL